MFPILIETPWFILPAWHTFFVLASIVAFLTFRTLYFQYAIPSTNNPRFVLYFLQITYISTYLGSRLFGILLEENPQSILDLLRKWVVLGPMVSYGGILFAVMAGTWVTMRFNRDQYRLVFSLAIPAGILAIAIGRIGCFLNGDDFGIILSAGPPLAFRFPHEVVHRLPIQLIELFCCLLIFAAAMAWGRRRGFERLDVGLLALGSYFFARFWIEFGRGDPRTFMAEWTEIDALKWMSLAQVVCLLGFLVVGSVWLRFGQNHSMSRHPK